MALTQLFSGCALETGGVGGLGSSVVSASEDDDPAAAGAPFVGAPDPASRSAVLVGLAVKGSDPATLAAFEEQAGADVGIVRVFARWDTVFPAANHEALLAGGRRIHLSVRPRTDGGRVIAWADIASAEPGSSTYETLNDWLVTVASYGSQIYFTLNHEPETGDSAANGTPAEFVAAWRKMATMLRAAGGDGVRTVLVLGRGVYADGSIEEWYPGDDVVDVIGVDAYNWYQCQGSDRAWSSTRILLLPALDYASAHGKPLAIPEIASTEDPEDPDRKAEWIRELADLLADPTIADRVEFVAWFSIHDRSWPSCQWEHDSSPQAAAALHDLIGWYSPGA